MGLGDQVTNSLLNVIANPTSGRANRLAAVLEAAREAGFDPVVHEPESADAAQRIAGSLARLGRPSTVVAAGGDGTFHTVVNGLLAAAEGHELDLPAVAVWPLGTANVTARELGIAKLRPAGLVKLIKDGVRQPVTVGRLRVADGEDKWFIQMASAGFDATVVAEMPVALKRALGGASYAVRALAALPGYEAPQLTVTIDGTTHQVQQVIVANGRLYGGGFVVAPDADLAAPTFEVCLFPGDLRDLVTADVPDRRRAPVRHSSLVPRTDVRRQFHRRGRRRPPTIRKRLP